MGSCIGLLHAGELGTALGRLLAAAGHRIVTTAAGRSSRTLQNATRAEFEVVDDVRRVVAESDVIISVVTPHSAVGLAETVYQCIADSARRRVFIDINSISPMTAEAIAARFEGALTEVVDATVHGQATQLETRATLFLSGSSAPRIETLFSGLMRVRNIGPRVGQASLQKMLLGGITKGMIAQFVQAAGLAQQFGTFSEFCSELSHFYPEYAEFLARSFPTYGLHAQRRAEEMREFAETLTACARPAALAQATASTIQSLAAPAEGSKETSQAECDEILRLMGDVAKLHLSNP